MRSSTIGSLSCMGFLALGAAGAALEATEAAAGQLRRSRCPCGGSRLRSTAIGWPAIGWPAVRRAAGRAAPGPVASDGTGDEVRPRDPHREPGGRVVAMDWVGHDLCGVLALGPPVVPGSPAAVCG